MWAEATERLKLLTECVQCKIGRHHSRESVLSKPRLHEKALAKCLCAWLSLYALVWGLNIHRLVLFFFFCFTSNVDTIQLRDDQQSRPPPQPQDSFDSWREKAPSRGLRRTDDVTERWILFDHLFSGEAGGCAVSFLLRRIFLSAKGQCQKENWNILSLAVGCCKRRYYGVLIVTSAQVTR